MSDTAELRKACIILAQNLTTGLDYIRGLSIFELIELCEDLKEIQKEVDKQNHGRL